MSAPSAASAAAAAPASVKKSAKSAHRKTAVHDAHQAGAAAAAAPAPFAAAAAASSSAVTAACALSATPRFVHPLHRCRFSTFMPHAIISLAFSHSGRFLALGRSNGNIEIWSVGANPAHMQAALSNAAQGGLNGWVLIKTIPGSGEATVQVIMWARAKGAPERLFSAGLNGRLIEWDLTGLAPRYASDTYGGAVWSGAIQETTLDGSSTLTIALGCEDGTIRLFDVSDATAPPLYNKALSRHSSRILSVAWSPDANFLASGGSDGMIKLWDLRNDGRNILRITVENKGLRRTTLAEGSAPDAKPNPRTKKHLHSDAERYTTYVWSLVFLTGSTLISGDSLGNLSVWELEFGTLRQHFPKALQGDVLTIVRNKPGDVLYASGVEGKIVELKKVSMSVDKEGLSGSAPAAASATPAPVDEDDSSIKWILTANHRQHTHDVYALAISPNTLPLAKVSSAGSLGSPKLNATQAPLPNNYLLVSGGVDTQLLLSPTTCFPDYNSLTRLLPFPQSRGGVCVADQIVAPSSEDSEGDDDDEDASPKSTAPKKLPARFLITHDQHLQLYGLGDYSYEATADKLRNRELHTQEHDTLPLDKSYTHLLDINVNSRKSVDTSNPSASIWVPGGGLNLLCSALSSNSRYIACSDPLQVKLYEITTQRRGNNPNMLSVRKIKNVANHVNPANVMCFSADSTRLFLGTLAGPIQILDLTSLDEDEEPRVQTLDEHVPQAVYEGDLSSSDEEDEAMDGGAKRKKKAASQRKQKLGVLRCLSVSHDQQYLCVSDEHSKAWIYELDSLRLAATLPAFSDPVLSLEFHPSVASTLAVLCARNTLFLYDVEAQKMTEYSKHNLGAIAAGQAQSVAAAAASAQALSSGGNLLAPASHLLSREQLTHLSWDRSVLSNGNSLLLQSLGLLCHINLDRPRPITGPSQLLTGAAAQSALSATQNNRRDRKRKADGLEDAAAAAASATPDPSSPLDPRQVNFRVVTRFKPMLYAGFIDESDGVSNAFKATQHETTDSNGKKKRKKDATDEAAAANGAATPAAAAAAAAAASADPSLVRPVVVGSSLLVIEAPWVNILQQLPQPLARHRYGT